MSATAIYPNSGVQTEKPEAVCRILILHEAFSAYTRAVEVCRRVMRQLGGELDFDIKCWSFIELADPACGRHAAKAAGAADVILIALQSGDLSADFEWWMNHFAVTRAKSDGVLTLLVEDLGIAAKTLEHTLLRMNDLAARYGVDFLPLFPDEASALQKTPAAPDWPALAWSRETVDSPTVDHWGLNE